MRENAQQKISSINNYKGGHRYLYIDVLNIAACFCVVLMHCANAVFIFDRDTTTWWYAICCQAVGIWAVPVFFMITGTTLLNYRDKYDTKTFAKKRILRTFVPFLVWSGIMFLFRVYVHHTLEWQGFGDMMRRLLDNGILGIYWFFFALFGVYLCIPIVSKIVKKENARLLWFWVLLFVLNNAIRPLLSRFWDIPLASSFIIPLADGMLSYCILGWLLHNLPPKKGFRIAIYAAGILGVFGIIFGTYFVNGSGSGNLDTLFMSATSICCIPLAASVFLLARHIRWSFFERPIPGRILKTMSAASFGVYLFHMIPLYMIRDLPFINVDSGRFMLFGSIAVYLGCMLFVSICRRIPLVRHLFP